MDLGHWLFPEKFDVNDWFGFVYRIIDTTTKQEYIGKKQFFSKQRKIVKGRKNRKIVYKESKWKSYTSSSTHVNNAIEAKGKDRFIFIIKSLHKTKGSLHYGEVSSQVIEDVLRARLDDGVTPKYLNKQIPGVRFIPPVELAEEAKMKVEYKLVEQYVAQHHKKALLTSNTRTCPHCNKTGKSGAMTRWHFDNCKHKNKK